MSQSSLLQSQSCQSLDDWLCYIEQSHPIEKIELGLSRVQRVAARAQLELLPGVVVLVAGTNGKGTTIRTIEQLLLAQGHSVGVYSSPHLLKFNERLRLNGCDATDAQWTQGLAQVEALRGEVALTYFEFTTLAAFAILKQASPAYCLIEVGLGGRLDATNIIDPALSVLTTVDLDHQDWLGPDRESIGREKAGIFRPARPVVLADLQPPSTALGIAATLACPVKQAGVDFHWQHTESSFQVQLGELQLSELPLPGLPLQNVCAALMVLHVLQVLPAMPVLKNVLPQLALPGRMQWLRQSPAVLADVAHNPQSAAYLAAQLRRLAPNYRQVHLLVGMLKDKDIAGALLPFTGQGYQWHLAGLPGPRGADAQQLQQLLPATESSGLLSDVAAGYNSLLTQLQPHDLLVVFGSFVTVSAVLAVQETL